MDALISWQFLTQKCVDVYELCAYVNRFCYLVSVGVKGDAGPICRLDNIFSVNKCRGSAYVKLANYGANANGINGMRRKLVITAIKT